MVSRSREPPCRQRRSAGRSANPITGIRKGEHLTRYPRRRAVDFIGTRPSDPLVIVKTDQDALRPYTEDASGMKGGHAEKVYVPSDEREAAALLAECAA